MARDDERMRVRERLGELEGQATGRRTMRGGRWDLEEVEQDDPDRDADVDRYDEMVESPRTPHWLSEPAGSVSLWHERLVPERFRGMRWHPGRRGVLVLAAAGVTAVVLAAAAAQRESPVAQPVPPLPAARSASATETAIPEPSAAADPDPATAPPPTGPVELVVSVVGLVEHGGLLHLPSGSRVADAVAISVAKQGADLTRLNLAQRLADGDQIVVGALGPDAGRPQLGSAVIPGVERSGRSAGIPGAATPSGPAAKVDLNTATESELDALPGVGPATARNILAWRTEHGRFTSIDQLTEIPGIGRSRLIRLRDLVTI